jgi:hypothetical protein
MSLDETRRAERKAVTLPVQCRTGSGLRDTGEISDISAQGCCVRTNSLFFRVGARVVLRPEGMEGLSGSVRWITGDCAGVEFDRPIYGPIVDHLAQLHRSGQQIALSQG